jgi:hypothetical protein
MSSAAFQPRQQCLSSISDKSVLLLRARFFATPDRTASSFASKAFATRTDYFLRR